MRCCRSFVFSTCRLGIPTSSQVASSRGSHSPAPWSGSRAVLLLDEPLSSLDPELRVTLRGELARLQRTLSLTMVYVTHDMRRRGRAGGPCRRDARRAHHVDRRRGQERTAHVRAPLLVSVFSLLSACEATGQVTPACRVLCAPEFKVEPTITFTNLFGSPRIVDEQGITTREARGT